MQVFILQKDCGDRLLPTVFFLVLVWSPSTPIWMIGTNRKKKYKECISWYWRMRTADMRYSQHLVIYCQISGGVMDLRFVWSVEAELLTEGLLLASPSAPIASLLAPWCLCGSAASWSSWHVWLKTNPDIWGGILCCYQNHVADPADLWPCQHQHKWAGGNGERGEGRSTGCALSASLTLMRKAHLGSVCPVS